MGVNKSDDPNSKYDFPGGMEFIHMLDSCTHVEKQHTADRIIGDGHYFLSFFVSNTFLVRIRNCATSLPRVRN